MIQSHIEEERRTIARELHDELGQSITAIRSFGLIIQQQARDRQMSAWPRRRVWWSRRPAACMTPCTR